MNHRVSPFAFSIFVDTGLLLPQAVTGHREFQEENNPAYTFPHFHEIVKNTDNWRLGECVFALERQKFQNEPLFPQQHSVYKTNLHVQLTFVYT